MSIDDTPLRDRIDAVFGYCDNCETYYIKKSAHVCRKPRTTGYKRVADRSARIERDTRAPDEDVVMSTSPHSHVYHRLDPDSDELRPDCCVQHQRESAVWERVTRRRCHELHRAPCGHCWPDVVESERRGDPA